MKDVLNSQPQRLNNSKRTFICIMNMMTLALMTVDLLRGVRCKLSGKELGTVRFKKQICFLIPVHTMNCLVLPGAYCNNSGLRSQGFGLG